MSCSQQKYLRMGLDGWILRLLLRHQAQRLNSSIIRTTQKSPIIKDGTVKQTRPLHQIKQSHQSRGQLWTLTRHQRDHEPQSQKEKTYWQREGKTKSNKTIKYEKGEQIFW